MSKGSIKQLQRQVLYPKPTTLNLKSTTARPSYSAPYGSAVTDIHPGTQTGTTVMRPYGGPSPSPLFLGSALQLGRSSVRVPVLAPPQTAIPTVMRKVFNRGR